MPQVRLRPKNQITIPPSIMEAAHFSLDDRLEIACANGVVTLTPVNRQQSNQSIMAYAGIAAGLWGTTSAEIDAELARSRDSWES